MKKTVVAVKTVKSPVEVKKELYNEVSALVKEWNRLYLEGTSQEVASLTVKLDKKLADLKSACQTAAFSELKKTEDPMFEVVKNPMYKTYRIKEDKNKETGIIKKELKEDEKFIQLVKLDKFCDGIGNDTNWKYMAEKLHYTMIVKAAKEGFDLDDDRIVKIKNCYAMEDIVRKTKLPGKNPVSNRSIVSTLQAVVNAMIGDEYKTIHGHNINVTMHDVNYMYSGYASHDNKTTNLVKIATKTDFIKTILCICHNRYAEIRYDLKCRDIKEK